MYSNSFCFSQLYWYYLVIFPIQHGARITQPFCLKIFVIDTQLLVHGVSFASYPDSKVHGAIMGPTWVLSAPDGPHDGPMNIAIWVVQKYGLCSILVIALLYTISCYIEMCCKGTDLKRLSLRGTRQSNTEVLQKGLYYYRVQCDAVKTRSLLSKIAVRVRSWWRHQMETFSALLAICAGNSLVPGQFPTQRPVMWSFDAFFHLLPNKRLGKHCWGWRFETPSRPLWRHCNGCILWVQDLIYVLPLPWQYSVWYCDIMDRIKRHRTDYVSGFV